MKAKKSLGQNFLRDLNILKKIVNFAQINKKDTVVEVGPGEGTLTKFILEQAKKVVAIEKDEKLVESLKEKFKEEIKSDKLEIVCGDILEIENLLKIVKLETENYVLVGNIPYYITGALFKKALESENPPKSITFVVQKEVAERILAKNKKESILSVSVKVYGEPEFGGVIKAGSFYPIPKVDSAIIAIRNVNKERFKEVKIQEEDFFKILKLGFAHKRKLLIKNLESVENIEEIFEKNKISKKIRAEDLKVEDWMSIAK